jgi:hypothetical protein
MRSDQFITRLFQGLWRDLMISLFYISLSWLLAFTYHTMVATLKLLFSPDGFALCGLGSV